MQHDFSDGKYTVVSDDRGGLTALRHGQPWQDLTGNNLVYWMLVEVDRLKTENERLRCIAGAARSTVEALDGTGESS